MSTIDPSRPSDSIWIMDAKATCDSLMASGVVVAVSLLALGVIYGLHPNQFFTSANYALLGTLGTVGGVSFIIFVISGALRIRTHCKPALEAVTPPSSSQPEAVPVEEPIPEVAASPSTTKSDPPLLVAVTGTPAPSLALETESIARQQPAAVAKEGMALAEDMQLKTTFLITKLEQLLIAFAHVYYRVENNDEKARSCFAHIKEGVAYFKRAMQSMSPIYSSKAQVVSAALVNAFTHKINRSTLTELLDKRNVATFIKSLPQLFDEKGYPGSEQTLVVAKTIYTTLSKNVELIKNLDYLTKFKALLTAHQALQKNEIDENQEAFEKAFNDLVHYFLLQVRDVPPDSIDLMISEYLVESTTNFFNDMEYYLSLLLHGHGEAGIFQRNRKKIILAQTTPGAAVTLVTLGQKDDLAFTIEKLLPALVDPFYYASSEKVKVGFLGGGFHAIYEPMKKLFQAQAKTRPNYLFGQKGTQAFDTYCTFLDKFIAHLKTLFPRLNKRLFFEGLKLQLPPALFETYKEWIYQTVLAMPTDGQLHTVWRRLPEGGALFFHIQSGYFYIEVIPHEKSLYIQESKMGNILTPSTFCLVMPQVYVIKELVDGLEPVSDTVQYIDRSYPDKRVRLILIKDLTNQWTAWLLDTSINYEVESIKKTLPRVKASYPQRRIIPSTNN